MLNKILKIFFLFNIVLISAKVFAAGLPAETRTMTINTTSLTIPKDGEGLKLLGTFEAKDDNMVIIKGSYGPHSYPTTASVVVNNPRESGKFYNNAKIFMLTDSSGSSNYGFTINITPLYTETSNESFPGGYIKKGNTNNAWIYAKNQNSSETFDTIYIGAKITIQIFAFQDPPSGISTIISQTIAKLNFKANRGSLGTSSGSVDIDINTFTINPSSNTCKITPSDNHIINMKPINIKNFPSIGSEVDGGDGTTIVLTCSQGATSVKVGMTDITERNNTSNQLKLDPRSTALGFAVTLYRDNENIITYNPNPKTGNNTWELSPSTSSINNVNYNVPIKAKYYRVGSVISPGTIIANAAITFIYE